MIENITYTLKNVIEHIDYEEITFAEIKQRLEMVIDDLERFEEGLDEEGFEG